VCVADLPSQRQRTPSPSTPKSNKRARFRYPRHTSPSSPDSDEEKVFIEPSQHACVVTVESIDDDQQVERLTDIARSSASWPGDGDEKLFQKHLNKYNVSNYYHHLLNSVPLTDEELFRAHLRGNANSIDQLYSPDSPAPSQSPYNEPLVCELIPPSLPSLSSPLFCVKMETV
jgi:hypothetical protein